jgi:hypothetical protein
MQAVGRKKVDRDDIRVIDSTLDVFGVCIRTGDFVVHAVTLGRSAILGISRVVEVRERLREQWKRCAPTPLNVTSDAVRHVDDVWERVDVWEPQLAVEKLNGQRTTIHCVDRVVRAPDGWIPPPGFMRYIGKR